MNEISTTKQYNYVALEWVKNEITATLKQARQSLEAFVENPAGQDLEFCLSFIHQVRAVLDMVELTEATSLTIEMEHLTQRLLHDEIAQSNKNEALEVLMQAIIHLPLYLERVQDNRRENQLLILALLNDLRTARGDELLAQTSELTSVNLPQITPLSTEKLNNLNAPEFTNQLRKLRQVLQLSLANIIRGNQVDTNLNHLTKVFTRIEQICANTPNAILWEIANALVAGLYSGEILAGATVRTLLRQVDRELKNLIDKGITAVNLAPPENLIKNLLFYISKAPGRAGKIVALKQKYNVGSLNEGENDLNLDTSNILDNATLVTVVGSLTEEISKVKDVLDLFVRSNRKDVSEITALKPQFSAIADTLVILNASDARQLVISQINLLDELAAGIRQIDNNLLLSIAGAILQVEVKLGSMLDLDEENAESMPTADVDIVNTVVIREAILDIEKTKEVIVEYINSDWDNEILAKVSPLMTEVYSVLQLIPLTRAAQLFQQCKQYIEEQLLALRRSPSWEELDHLADAISGIEYYLESIVTDYDGNHEETLELAEANLQILTSSITAQNTSNVENIIDVDISEHDSVKEGISNLVADDFSFAYNEIIADQSANADGDDIFSAQPKNDEFDVPSSQAPESDLLNDVSFNNSANFELSIADHSGNLTSKPPKKLTQEDENIINSLQELEDSLEVAQNAEPKSVTNILTDTPTITKPITQKSTPSLNLPALLPPPANEPPVDEELQEIFVEEVGEVLEIINEYLPKWRNNFANKSALTEVRRAFHTLKGSGRMVRALVLGELAWAIENLLNRVLDKSIVANDDVLNVVQQVVDLTPALCKEFELQQQRRRDDVDFLAATANAMAKGGHLPQKIAENQTSIVTTEDQVIPTRVDDDTTGLNQILEVELKQDEQIQTPTQNDDELFNFDVINENLDHLITESPLELKADTVLTDLTVASQNLDYKLIDIFQSETQIHLDVLLSFYNDFTNSNGVPCLVTPELHRALHTLKGSASMADISSVLAIVTPLEQMAKFCKSHDILWGRTEVNLLFSCLEQIHQALISLNLGDLVLTDEAQQLINAVEKMNVQHVASANEQRQSVTSVSYKNDAIKGFLSYGMDTLTHIEQIFNDPLAPLVSAEISKKFSELQQRANLAEQTEVMELCANLQQIYAIVSDQQITLDELTLSALKHAHEELMIMFDQIAVHWHANRNSALIHELEQLKQQLATSPPVTWQKPVPVSAQAERNLDWKIINLFLEGAQDALEAASFELEAWLGDPTNSMGIALILSELRTLKNGARMVQLPELLELTQKLEILYRGVRTKKYPHGEELASLLLRCHETLTNQLDALGNQQILERDVDLLQAIANFLNGTNPPDGGNLTPFPTNNSPSITPLTNFGSDASAFDTYNHNDNLNSAGDESTLPTANLITADPKPINNFAISSITNGEDELTTQHTSGPVAKETNLTAEQNNAENIAVTDDFANLTNTAENNVSSANLDDEISNTTGVLDTLEEENYLPLIFTDNTLADDDNHTFDADLIAMVAQTVQDSVSVIDKILQQWPKQISDLNPLKKASLELENIQEQADLTDLTTLAQFTQQLAQIYNDVITAKLFYRSSLVEFLQEANHLIISYLDCLAKQQKAPNLDELWLKFANLKIEASTALDEDEASQNTATNITDTSANSADFVHYDSELLPTFLEEAVDVLENANNALGRWIENPENLLELASLQRDLHTVKGGARMAEVAEMATFAHELEYLYEALNDGRLQINPQLFDLLNACHDQLALMLEDLRTTRTMPSADPFIKAVQNFRSDPNQYQAVPLSVSVQDVSLNISSNDGQADADLLEIFFDEATELLEEFEGDLAKWDKDRTSDAPIKNIMRVLHTLKGSSRLAKFSQIGDLSHNIEQQITECYAQKQPVSTISDNIQASYLQLCKLLESAKNKTNEIPASSAVIKDNKTNLVATQKTQTTLTAPAQQEMIKVVASQIDNLVNLAGETSIYRGRIEQQVSDFGSTLTEMESTIERVCNQLRRLDIETQAQILSSIQEERANYEDFDPLEMDRHSHLQQLSRSLFESASDLLDLTGTLHNRSRDTKNLLIQQAQINTELQEGLMRTRMIAFAKIAPRLNRIVRQLSRELGKKVEFKIINADNEMDRSVLERVIAPLEHMLRNAIDHGIEDVNIRQKLGKPAVGQIELELHREGGDIVLSLRDDGAGINVAKVQAKAIERGLMQPSSDLTDHEIMRFVLEAGFSTAQKVTQVSGRGVGMDVAISEVKQIGGVIDIDSNYGKGTTFSIRLPFTLSVNRALMVYLGDDLYAIPLNTIDGVVRITPQDLSKYYASNNARFDYAGQDYDLRYFGNLINNSHLPKLSGSMPLPVILVRSREYAVAVQVDALAGSHEIVVKNLGPQFTAVPGLSGATLLGDGRVVIILDLLATIRQQHAQIKHKQEATPTAVPLSDVEHRVKVMIVDDSVTVRKVTTRLLERRGMIVSTAKDGVDAIAQLQDMKPDVMLLDIEMPRMDGFEVASTVRHDERLQDLPIIMITSRTGDKHRERALSLGVNSYLGKPYQEDQLLETISKLVGVKI